MSRPNGRRPRLSTEGERNNKADEAETSLDAVPVKNTAATDQTNHTHAAQAITGAPVGRRRLWYAIVGNCPHCGALHIHRSGPAKLLSGAAERSCPVTGRPYMLVPARRRAA